MLNGKKGNAQQIVMAVVIIFFLAVSLISSIFIFDKFADVVKDTALNDTGVASDVTDKMDIISSNTVQQTFVFIIAIQIIAMFISAFLVRSHPLWFFLYVIILGVCIFSAAPMANAYQAMIEAPAIANSVAGQQDMMNWVMNNFVKIILGSGLITTVIALSKLGTGGEFGSDI